MKIKDSYRSLIFHHLFGIIMSGIIFVFGIFLIAISFVKYFGRKAFWGEDYLLFLGLKQVF